MRVHIGDGVHLFFDVAGSGLDPQPDVMEPKPTLLLLHGGPGGDHSSFRPYFDRFASTHQVVYVDQRGQGRSDKGDPSDWNLDTWADDVVRFCAALGIEQPHVLGLSFGGFVAIRYAARHPGHCSKMVLASTAARRMPDLTAAQFDRLGGEAAAASYRRVMVDGDTSADAMTEYFALCMPTYNRVPSGFGPARTMLNLEVLEAFMTEWAAMDLRSDVERIQVPTLVIGGLEDPMTPSECSVEIADLLPSAVGELHLLEACGHGSFRDQPEETEAILREFLTHS